MTKDMGVGEGRGVAVVTAPRTSTAETPTVADRLRELRADLHVNELRHGGTRDGNLFARWGATTAFALIEIETLRAITAALLPALKAIVALDDGDAPDLWHFQAEFDAARAAIAKAEGR